MKRLPTHNRSAFEACEQHDFFESSKRVPFRIIYRPHGAHESTGTFFLLISILFHRIRMAVVGEILRIPSVLGSLPVTCETLDRFCANPEHLALILSPTCSLTFCVVTSRSICKIIRGEC